jgi:hypothetical protein
MYTIDTNALLRIADGEERYEKSCDEFNRCREDLSQEIKKYMKEEGISSIDLSTFLGIDPGGLSRSLRKPFAVPLDKMTLFCYEFMHQSCHELFFGQSANTRLPRMLSYIVKIMMGNAVIKKRVYERAEALYTQHRNANTLLTGCDTVDIVRARILEWAGDIVIPAKYLCGIDSPMPIRSGLSRLAEGERTSLRINTVMYYTLIAETTLDYFLAVDYTQYTNIFLHDASPNDTIHDRFIRRFVGRYLTLPQEAKDELAQIAMLACWNS